MSSWTQNKADAPPYLRTVIGKWLWRAPCLGLCALLLLLWSAPAKSVTPLEAAQINGRLAIGVCLQNHNDGNTLMQAMNAAGFSYVPEDFGGGPWDILHWFYAPANTMSVAVVIEQNGSIECRVTSELYGVTEALRLAKTGVAEFYSGQILDGSPEGSMILPGSSNAHMRECDGFHLLVPRKLIWVKVGNAGQDPVCVEDGTSQIMMKM